MPDPALPVLLPRPPASSRASSRGGLAPGREKLDPEASSCAPPRRTSTIRTPAPSPLTFSSAFLSSPYLLPLKSLSFCPCPGSSELRPKSSRRRIGAQPRSAQFLALPALAPPRRTSPVVSFVVRNGRRCAPVPIDRGLDHSQCVDAAKSQRQVRRRPVRCRLPDRIRRPPLLHSTPPQAPPPEPPHHSIAGVASP